MGFWIWGVSDGLYLAAAAGVVAAFPQQRQAQYQSQIEALHQQQPWQQPGYTRMQNPLLSRGSIPNDQESDPGAGMLGYFMGGGGSSIGGAADAGAGMNPMLMQMLMGGSGGAL
jgi:hypothetical protein